MVTVPLHDRPLAAHGLVSYRCRSPFGWIMIGARDKADAIVQAMRSSQRADLSTLEVWTGARYESLP